MPPIMCSRSTPHAAQICPAVRFSPTLALVIWYVFGNGKHQIPWSHTLKQGDALHVLSPTPEEDICRKVNLTLSHV